MIGLIFMRQYKTNMSQIVVRYILFSASHRKLFFLCVAFFAFSLNSYSQKKVIDSLKNKLVKTEESVGFKPQDTVYINLLNNLAYKIRYYQLDSLYSLSKKALDYSNDIHYIKGKVSAHLNLGAYYEDKGNYTKALSHLKKSQTLALTVNCIDHVLENHNAIGIVYEFQEEYSLALKEYLKGIEIAKDIKNIRMQAILNENIGILYAKQNDYKQAMQYYKEVNRLTDIMGDDVFMASSMCNLTHLYIESKKLDIAMHHINYSITILEKNEILDWLAMAYELKGKVYLYKKQYEQALFWYNQSKKLHTKILNDDRAEIDLLWGLAEANLGLGKSNIAKNYAIKGFNVAQRMNLTKEVKRMAKTLYKIHKNDENYVEALAYHELYQELADTISRKLNMRNLSMLKTEAQHDQQKQLLIAKNNQTLAKQKNYVYAFLIILLVLLLITFLVRRNEKLQKSLNKELNTKKNDLEKREIELQKTNATKDRLFSIIGHDLRGPIGAFQSLLDLFSAGEITKKELLEFIPKFRADIHHISFTLNNLLSWGQAQMNGVVTKPSRMFLEKIVDNNMNLLSEIADKKSIKMVNYLPDNTVVWSDVNQIDIVIRNLMSNALKFTPKNGVISISAKEMDNHWRICVSDTGIGIKPEIKTQIFKENSKITTFGTNNEKGTGLGLSLCKEMIENNKGSIWVESTIEKGAHFYFTLPKMEEKYEKAS